MPKKPEHDPNATEQLHSSESCNSFKEDAKSEEADAILRTVDTNMRAKLKLMHEA